ncbi:hypothetical protein ACQKDB_01655, partial [Planococcus kocurii]|uniref:hypothetical protein n=1 Tax=Planococcus kocurii TaxID=1374 RepID=UPI003D00F138
MRRIAAAYARSGRNTHVRDADMHARGEIRTFSEGLRKLVEKYARSGCRYARSWRNTHVQRRLTHVRRK